MFICRWALFLLFAFATICNITCMVAQELTPKESLERQPVYPLPGALSDEPLFNSNNPEVVQTEGILLSTLSPAGKASPSAHLNYTFSGRFGIFSHHIYRPADQADTRTLYQAILLHNPDRESEAEVAITSGASYLSQPDAPFKELPSLAENENNKTFAGPGSRVGGDLLHGKRPSKLIKRRLTVKPGDTSVLAKLPIPVQNLLPPLNGRSTLLHLNLKRGKLQVAEVSAFASCDAKGRQTPPADETLLSIAEKGNLAFPREKPASAPGAGGSFAYGRVAGVSRGTHWLMKPDQGEPRQFEAPLSGEQYSFLISGLERGTFGTGQIQAAPLMVRYEGSAYAAHGNYGVFYDVVIPIKNSSSEPRDIEVTFQTPLKSDKNEGGLTFADPPYKPIFFRGTVRLTYPDRRGKLRSKHFHLVQHRGERGLPLARIRVPSLSQRQIRLQFIYPPDATPPQVITIKSVG